MNNESKLKILTIFIISFLLLAMIIDYTRIKDMKQLRNSNVGLESNLATLQQELEYTEYQLATKYIENLSFEECIIMLNIVEAEATGHSVSGKQSVAEVILNRIKSPKFPNNLKTVVFQDRQFSPISDGRYGALPITLSTIDGVSLALQGSNITGNSLYFMCESLAEDKNVNWFKENLEYVITIEPHSFWK